MYLSRLTLNPRDRVVRSWLGDCHRLHRAIMSGFPHLASEAARAELGVLYRVEAPDRDGAIAVLVQSRIAPAWGFETPAVQRHPALSLEALVGGFAVGKRYRFRLRANPTRRVHHRATLGADHRELDTKGNWREAGQLADHERTGIVRRDYAEPASAWVERADGKRIGKRVDLRREEDRVAWLQRKSRESGFTLVTTRLAPGIGALQPHDYVATRADPAGSVSGKVQGTSTTLDRKLTFGTALFEGELEVTDPDLLRRCLETGIGPGKAFGCGLLSLAPI